MPFYLTHLFCVFVISGCTSFCLSCPVQFYVILFCLTYLYSVWFQDKLFHLSTRRFILGGGGSYCFTHLCLISVQAVFHLTSLCDFEVKARFIWPAWLTHSFRLSWVLTDVSVLYVISGRAVFRLTYLTEHNYKHHDFEAEVSVAMEIVQKLKNILELRLSPARKEFITSQDRKLRKRDSLKFSM